MPEKKKIIVCPLDWGLGHATRCVPVIKKLLEHDLEIYIAADNRPLAFLEKEFPSLRFIRYEGFQIKYSISGTMVNKMLSSIPGILKGIRKEHERMVEFVDQYKINAIISDNRFGCWHENIPSVYMTHQLKVKTPGYFKLIEPLLIQFHRNYINKYTCCWVPDFKDGISLSGELSQQKINLQNYYYIGPLSRFSQYISAESKNAYYDFKILGIISGPEPQRGILQELLTSQLQKLNYKSAIICGKTESSERSIIDDKIFLYDHLDSKELFQLIIKSENIICRSGYSSIMDLACLGKKALLIPTPGQTEQEYLAELHKNNGFYYSEKQQLFNIETALIESVNYKPPKIDCNDSLMDESLIRFIKKI